MGFIFLTARDSIEERIESIESGAVQYLTKPFSPVELKTCITSILKRESQLLNYQIEHIKSGIDHLLKHIQQPHLQSSSRESTIDQILDELNLSKRENDVMRLLLQGKSDKEISIELAISPRTVANHNRRIYAKADVKSRVELITKISHFYE